jgi:hypothetical protein
MQGLFVPIFALFFAASAGAVPQQPKLQGIAILDLRAVRGVDASMADLLNEILVARVSRSGRFSSVVAGSDLRAMMDLEAQKAAVGCADTSCIADMAGALGVPLLIAPTVGRLGANFVFGMKVIDVERATVLIRSERSVGADRDLRAAVHALVGDTIAAWDRHTGLAQQRFKRRLSVGLLVAGGGALAAGYLHHAEALSSYRATPSVATQQNTESAADLANLASGAGGALFVAAVWLWWGAR